MIGIVGTGLLGTGFATAALGRGLAVRVWNRTAAKAATLVARGAEIAGSPSALADGLRRIHVVLSDDAAVDAVLEAMAPAPGTVIYDHTTTSTTGAIDRPERWRSRGVTYLHAFRECERGLTRESTAPRVRQAGRTTRTAFPNPSTRLPVVRSVSQASNAP